LWGTTHLPSGRWNHIAAVYDGASLRLLVNGVVDAAQNVSGTLPLTTRPLQVGRDGWANVFVGRLDEVQVFDAALTAADVATVMDTPVDSAAPLMVMRTSPAADADGVMRPTIDVTFSRALDAASVVPGAFILVDASGAVVATNVTYDAASRTATLAPQSPLAVHTTYTATVLSGAAGVHDISGTTLVDAATWSFRTAGESSMVGAWSFTETLGTVTADKADNGNTGALSGDAAWEIAGRIGTGVRFAGNGGVDVAVTESLQLDSDFTVAAWVAPEGSGWQSIVTQRALDLSPQIGLYVDASYRAYVEVRLNGQLHSLSGTIPLAAGNWNHIAATYDGTTLTLLVNGVVDQMRPVSGTLTPSTRTLQIGRDWSANFFAGRIDEVRVYDSALSSDAILYAMSTPLDVATPLTVTRTTPVAGSSGVVTTPITATFSQPIDPSSISSSVVTLVDDKKKVIAATVSYESDTRTLTITPGVALTPLTTYTVTLRSGVAGVRDIGGGTLAADVVWSFRRASTNGLVGYWKFSEGGGTTTVDESGNANTGTLTGDVQWTNSGRVGKSLRYNLLGGVDIATTDSLALRSAFTIMAYVAPEGSGWQPILAQRASDLTPQLGIYLDAGYRPYIELQLDGALWAMRASTPIPAGEWSHVKATFDGATVQLLVNDIVVGTMSVSGSMTPSVRTIQIGRDSGNNTFRGRIDEVQIYDTILSECNGKKCTR
jgi:hypothetical protein